MRTVIVGLGNPFLSDDGVGCRVLSDLRERLSPAELRSICLTEASVGGLRLMELMCGYDRAIVVDAMNRPGSSHVGKIWRLSLAELSAISPTQNSASAHDMTLSTAVELGKRLGLAVPDEVVIFAVEAAEVAVFSELLSPAVMEAVPEVVNAVLAEVRRADNQEVHYGIS